MPLLGNHIFSLVAQGDHRGQSSSKKDHYSFCSLSQSCNIALLKFTRKTSLILIVARVYGHTGVFLTALPLLTTAKMSSTDEYCTSPSYFHWLFSFLERAVESEAFSLSFFLILVILIVIMYHSWGVTRLWCDGLFIF